MQQKTTITKDLVLQDLLEDENTKNVKEFQKKCASEIIDQIKQQGNTKESVKEHVNEFKD